MEESFSTFIEQLTALSQGDNSVRVEDYQLKYDWHNKLVSGSGGKTFSDERLVMRFF